MSNLKFDYQSHIIFIESNNLNYSGPCYYVIDTSSCWFTGWREPSGSFLCPHIIFPERIPGHHSRQNVVIINLSSVVLVRNRFVFTREYKNLPQLCTGTGKSTRVSKDLQFTTRLAENLWWYEGGLPCRCTKSRLIIFLLPLPIFITKGHFCFQELLQNIYLLEDGANLS